jgi:uncharacterized protein (DUF169 family)
MESEIANAIGLKYEPVAIILTDERPEGAIQFKEGKFGCVMSMLAATVQGKEAVFDRQTLSCPGGATGLGFGNRYENLFGNLPGGMELYYYSQSVGNEQWEIGISTAELIKPFVTEELYDIFVHGEKRRKTPELVKDFLKYLPITQLPFEYVVFKPLKEVDIEKEIPEVVVYLVNIEQISNLVGLANYSRGNDDNVIIPCAAGCQLIGIYPFREAKSKRPRAVVGVDRHSSVQVKRQLKEDLVTFAVPFTMFREMEANVPGSFLESSA